MTKQFVAWLQEILNNATPRELRQKHLPFIIWFVLLLLMFTPLMTPAIAIAVMEFCMLFGIYSVVEHRATKEILYYTKFVVLYGLYSTCLNLIEGVFIHVLNPDSVARFTAVFKILLTMIIYHTGTLDTIYSGMLKGRFYK